MKKLLLIMTLATLGLGGLAASATAGPDDVCGGTKVDVGDLPATIDGVVITLVSPTQVNFNIVEGTTVTVCVKAGSGQQGDGPEEHTITVDTTFTHSTLKDLSHVSIISVSTPTTTTTTTTVVPPPPPPPTTTTTVVPPPPPPTTTTTVVPPPVTTTTTTTTTAPPPTTTQPPPPPDNQPPNAPPPDSLNPPDKLAFTGPEDMLPVGLVALALLLLGSGLVWTGRKAN